MGSYVATMNLFSTSGSIVEQSDGQNTMEMLNDHTTESGEVVHIFSGNFISLDGNPAISFAGLPAGFALDDIAFHANESSSFTTAMGYLGRGSASDVTKSIVTWGVHGPVTTNGAVSPTFSNIFSPDVGTPLTLKPIDLLSSLVSDLSTILNIGVDASLFARVYKNLKATGNYEIYRTVTTLPTTVAKGEDVKITAPSSLDLISTVTVATPAGATFPVTIVSETPTEVHITWPDMGAFTGPALMVATEFSGRSYVLSPMVVILDDPSGIYQIVPGKTNDTLYVDHSTGTQDVAIPNPFVKTGFVGG